MTQQINPPPAPHLALLCRAVSVLAVICGLGALFAGLTNDTNTLLQYSLHLVREGELYERWFEVNPPLIMLIYAPVAFLIDRLHAPPAPTLHAYTLLLAGCSLWRIHRLLRLHADDSTARQLWMAGAAFALVIAPFICSAFGDREHLLYIAALPWVMCFFLGAAPSLPTSIAAGIGFCIKPYNVLICAAFILFGQNERLRVRHFFTAGNIGIILVGLSYILTVWLFFPFYLLEVVPTALVVYGMLQADAYARVFGVFVVCLPCIIVAATAGGISRRERRLWLAWFYAAGLCIVLNGGWSYTFFHAALPATLLAFRLLPGFVAKGKTEARYATLSFVAWALIAGIVPAYSLIGLGADILKTRETGFSSNYHFPPNPDMMPRLQESAGGTFILLSTTLWGANLARMDAPPSHVFGYDYLMPLPWLATHPDDPRWQRVAQPLLRELKQALLAGPDSIIVDKSPTMRGIEEPFDIVAFFRKDPSLDRLFGGYAPVGTLDYCTETWRKACHFEIWKRAAQPAP